VNHRSTRADFRMLVEAVVEIGKELLEEAEPESGRSAETVYQIQNKAQHD